MKGKKFKLTFSFAFTIILLMASAALFVVSAWIAVTENKAGTSAINKSVIANAANIEAAWKIEYAAADGFDGFEFGAPGTEMLANITITSTNSTAAFVYEIDFGFDHTRTISSIDGTDLALGKIRFPNVRLGGAIIANGKYYGVIDPNSSEYKENTLIAVKLKFLDTLTNDSQTMEFLDDINIICCQATKPAIIDVFGNLVYNALEDNNLLEGVG